MRLMLLIFMLMLLAACGLSSGTTRPRGQITIENIDVRIAESYPVQVFVQVTGSLSDGCTSLGAITQQRNNTTIDVVIAAKHSGADVCTMVAPLVDETIALEGPFPTGQYTLRVNGIEQTFRV